MNGPAYIVLSHLQPYRDRGHKGRQSIQEHRPAFLVSDQPLPWVPHYHPLKSSLILWLSGMKFFLEYGLVTVRAVLFTPSGLKVTSVKATLTGLC